ncbi:flagellar type III secretion system protein FliR [candidate division KSB1 bacterium]|nr:MAG: flagellar type III secretion system protein FliR [candidate division KSB1 bacterium]
MYNLSFHQFIVFFLGFVRIATILCTVPVFGFNAVPNAVKAGLAFLVSLVMYPIIDAGNFRIPIQLWPFIFLVLKEVTVGLIIGLSTAFLFVGIQMAGQLVGLDMGFGIVNVLDPLTGEQVSIMGQFQYVLALIIFLLMDGHHFFLQAIKASYDVIPVGGVVFSKMISGKIVEMSGKIFIIALKIGGPALAALFLTDFVMGIVARTVPQMNIFIVGFPLKISVGLLIVGLSLPLFIYVFDKLVEVFKHDVVQLIQIL